MTDDRLRIHVLADRSDPSARAANLPDSPAGTWPVLDAVVLNRPERAQITQQQVEHGVARGWIVGEGHNVVVRGAGPAGNQWLTTPAAPQPHVFHHYTALVIGKNDTVRYRVVRNPDKYVRGGKDTDKVTDKVYDAGQTEIVWHYELELEKG